MHHIRSRSTDFEFEHTLTMPYRLGWKMRDDGGGDGNMVQSVGDVSLKVLGFGRTSSEGEGERDWGPW